MHNYTIWFSHLGSTNGSWRSKEAMRFSHIFSSLIPHFWHLSLQYCCTDSPFLDNFMPWSKKFITLLHHIPQYFHESGERKSFLKTYATSHISSHHFRLCAKKILTHSIHFHHSLEVLNHHLYENDVHNFLPVYMNACAHKQNYSSRRLT